MLYFQTLPPFFPSFHHSTCQPISKRFFPSFCILKAVLGQWEIAQVFIEFILCYKRSCSSYDGTEQSALHITMGTSFSIIMDVYLQSMVFMFILGNWYTYNVSCSFLVPISSLLLQPFPWSPSTSPDVSLHLYPVFVSGFLL